MNVKVTTVIMETALDEVYTDPRQPGSFSGPAELKKGLECAKKSES